MFQPVLTRIEAIHPEVLRAASSSRCTCTPATATCTNIPVNSDNYEMLQAANRAVDRIMALARALDGVISGERHRHHQARLPDRRGWPFWAYKAGGPAGPLQPRQADAECASNFADAPPSSTTPTRRAST